MHGLFQCVFYYGTFFNFFLMSVMLLKVCSTEAVVAGSTITIAYNLPGLEMQLPILNSQAMLTKLGEERALFPTR